MNSLPANYEFSCLGLTEGHVDALASAHELLDPAAQHVAMLAFASALASYTRVQTWELQRSLKIATRAVN